MTRKKELSQDPKNVTKRTKTADARELRNLRADAAERAEAGKVTTPPAEVSTEVVASAATIGVETPAAAASEKPELFHCSNCDQDITKGMTECPTCELPLNWPTEAS